MDPRRRTGTPIDALLRAAGFIPAPSISLDPIKLQAFEHLALNIGSGQEVPYVLPHPKYEFLQWISVTRHDLAFHGSVRGDLTELRPVRMSRDASPFGNQQAVYASNDALWAMYFAVLNRSSNPSFRGTKNACLRPSKGLFRNSYYYFSVNPEAHNDHLLTEGWVYLVPRSDFLKERTPLALYDPGQLASQGPVRCLGRMSVGPWDFPFQDLIVTHQSGESELKVLRRTRLAKRQISK